MDTGTYSSLIESGVRAYNNRLKRQKIVRRQWTILALVLGLIITAIVIISTTKVLEAHSETKDTIYKYYTQIEVHPGDTLWEYASKYASPSHYKCDGDYVREVRAINHFEEDYIVKAGELIVIPYFSNEYR